MGRRHNFIKQKKSLGQVFLKESWPCERIIDELYRRNIQNTIEIGPGAGILTKKLVESNFKVTAIEKDDRFAATLPDILLPNDESAAERLDIINQDVLKVDFNDFLYADPKSNAIVGNIPYNISTPIVIKMLEVLPKISIGIIMVQLEFAKRVISSPGTKDYGSLSIFCQLRSNVKMLFKVPRGCFRPIPKIDSAMIAFTPGGFNLEKEHLEWCEKFVRACFNQRRKQLRNSVKKMIRDLDESSFPIDLNRRAETLTLDEVIKCGEFLRRNAPAD